MNRLFLILLLTLAAFLPSKFLFSQGDPLALKSFTISQVENKLYFQWVIYKGFACSGVDLESSTDSTQFSSFYRYDGICGSDTTDKKYEYQFSSPSENRVIYYRLNLGTNGISAVRSFRFINAEEEGFIILPNPVTVNSVIYFPPQPVSNRRIEIIAATGTPLGEYKTDNNEFRVGETGLLPGIFIIRIMEDDLFKGYGRIIVQ